MKKPIIYSIAIFINVFFIILLFSLSGCYIHTDPGTGKKIGRIVRFSKQGMLYKTWEGELIRGGITDGSGTLGGSFHFTIEDERLANKALDAFENQFEVIIDYRREFVSSWSRSEGSDAYFVDNITVVK
jgi:hypothetical protein